MDQKMASTSNSEWVLAEKIHCEETPRLPGGGPINLLMIGKTGHGKSSTGNTILGSQKFTTDPSMVTSSAVAYSLVDGRQIKVVDTQGMCESIITEQFSVIDTLGDALEFCAPGFHAILIIFSARARCTSEEKKALRLLKEILGKDIIKFNCICVVTHGDYFKIQVKGKSFQEWCREEGRDNFPVFEECQYRCVLFDNATKDKEERNRQLIELVTMVDKIGAFYTNELFDISIKKRLPSGGPIRLLLIGKSSPAKSSTGNTILGQPYFKIGIGTTSSPFHSSVIDGREILVVGTPEMCGSYGRFTMKDNIQAAFSEALSIHPQGFHAILLVFDAGIRYTSEEKKEIEMLKEILGKDIIKLNCICIITHVDELKRQVKDKTFQEWCREEGRKKFPIFEECQYRCVLFDNVTKNQEDQKQQLIELITVVDTIGTFYINNFVDTPIKERLLSDGPINLLLIGKTGHGKSSTGNTIIGSQKFKTILTHGSITSSSSIGFGLVDGRTIKVVDTPGMCDTREDSGRFTIKDNIKAFGKALAMCAPGFHALLLVFRAGTRYTREEKRAIELLKKVLGKDIIKLHSICVVTRGDDFKRQVEDKSFQEWCIEEGRENFPIFEECQYRCVLFDNVTADDNERKHQLIELVTMVDKIGTFYTNELFDKSMKDREETIKSMKALEADEKHIENVDIVISILENNKRFSKVEIIKDNLKHLNTILNDLKSQLERIGRDKNKDFSEALYSLADKVDIILNGIKRKESEGIAITKDHCSFDTKKELEAFKKYSVNLSSVFSKVVGISATTLGIASNVLGVAAATAMTAAFLPEIAGTVTLVGGVLMAASKATKAVGKLLKKDSKSEENDKCTIL